MLATSSLAHSCSRHTTPLIVQHALHGLRVLPAHAIPAPQAHPLRPADHLHRGAQRIRGMSSPQRCSAAAGDAQRTASEQYQRLDGVKVWLVSEQKQVPITDLWDEKDRAFLVFARSMGCNFCQELARDLQRQVLPKLRDAGIKLYLVSIGPPERGTEFAELTDFPPELLLADPENVTYDKLELKNTGPIATFFDPRTPLTLFKRLRKDGLKGAREALAKWKPWIPPGKGQAYQQGGAFLFNGRELVWSHYDPATGAHAEPEEILAAADL